MQHILTVTAHAPTAYILEYTDKDVAYILQMTFLTSHVNWTVQFCLILAKYLKTAFSLDQGELV